MDPIKVTTRTGKGSPLTTVEMDANLTALCNAINAVIQATPDAGNRARGDVQVATAALDPGATGYVQADLGRAYHILAMATDFPARVRVYETSAHRAADAARAQGVLPVNDHGMVAEIVTTGSVLAVRFAPCPFGANLDSPTAKTAYFAITNKDVVARTITLTVTRLPLEL
jgi:hypothetical protein